VLIPPGSIEKAEDLLASNEYTARASARGLTPRQKGAYSHAVHHLEYLNPKSGILVEIHPRLSFDWYFLPSDFEQNAFASNAEVNDCRASIAPSLTKRPCRATLAGKPSLPEPGRSEA
jgi:hypothetical protein